MTDSIDSQMKDAHWLLQERLEADLSNARDVSTSLEDLLCDLSNDPVIDEVTEYLHSTSKESIDDSRSLYNRFVLKIANIRNGSIEHFKRITQND